MTYGELLERLAGAGIESAAWEAECLLSHYCAASAAVLRADPARSYTNAALEEAVRRRCEREPLQYLLGEWEFYRQTYRVTPDCLIPRSDTEILVEEAIRRLPHGAHFADLCTGSGCIAVSVLAERPDTHAIALEKYPRTLALATENAERNGVSDRFFPICADVTAPPPACFSAPLDAILSNPPYIVRDVLATLSPEVHAEPQAALDGGIDGLDFYRAILNFYTPLLAEDGFFLFEIGYDQGEALLSLGRTHGFSAASVIRDLGGNDRVVLLSRRTQQSKRKDGIT